MSVWETAVDHFEDTAAILNRKASWGVQRAKSVSSRFNEFFLGQSEIWGFLVTSDRYNPRFF